MDGLAPGEATATADRIDREDAARLERVVHKYHASLVGYARTLCGGYDQAEDVVQEVWAAVWRRRTARAAGDITAAYLYRCVRNTALNARRTTLRQRRLLVHVSDLRLTPAAPSAEQIAVMEAMISAYYSAVDGLPPASRRVFDLWTSAGMDRRTVARQLKLSVKTVDEQLRRARRRISAALSDSSDL